MAIERPVYDFSLHLRSDRVVRIEPANVVLVEGILVLADKGLRNRLDLEIYVDTDPDLRLARRLEGTSQRGAEPSSLCWTSTSPRCGRCIWSSWSRPKRYADLIIRRATIPGRGHGGGDAAGAVGGGGRADGRAVTSPYNRCPCL